MTKQTGTISVTIEYDDDGETTFLIPSGFEGKRIELTEDATGELTVAYKRIVSSLYDDPQILDEDWRQAAESRIRETTMRDELSIDSDAEVFIDGDGAYVQVWMYVDTEDGLDQARDRQARDFNHSRMTEN